MHNKKQWDDKKKQIKNIHPNYLILNRRILKDFADLQSELLLASDEKVNEFLNPTLIKKVDQPPKLTVLEFVDNLITELKSDNKIGNAWVYESALNAVKKFHSDRELYISMNVTPPFQFMMAA